MCVQRSRAIARSASDGSRSAPQAPRAGQGAGGAETTPLALGLDAAAGSEHGGTNRGRTVQAAQAEAAQRT